MSKSCVYMPNKGKKTFIELKTNFGYEAAAEIFNRIVGQQFLDKFEDSLTLDSEGIPTYQSLMKNKLVREYLGEQTILDSMSKKMPHYDDTVNNTTELVNLAYRLNNDPQYSDYVAIVDYDKEKKLTITFLPRNEENLEIAQTQIKIQRLNERVSELLSSAGVNLSFLSSIETAAGRVGITNFNHAKDIANNFTGLIQIANNMEGNIALSEEFSHLLVGLYRDTELVKRSINFFLNEDKAKEVLGARYEEVSAFYDGDPYMIAEEVVGHLLRDQLVNKVSIKQTPLIERIANFIKRLFRGINPGYYQDSIDTVSMQLGDLAEKIISNKQKFTKEDIAKAYRNARFNALTDKAKAQVEVLKKITENAFKASYLQENLSEKLEGQRTAKSRARKVAESISKRVNDNLAKEETMAAIGAYLDIALADVSRLYDDLDQLENLSVEDKFRILKNALYVAQSYTPTLEELRTVTTQEYIEDEGIAKQEFMYSDIHGTLSDFETNIEVSPENTTGMSSAGIADKIVSDSSDFELSEDETYYVNKKTGEKYKRVTSVIDADRNAEEPFDPKSPWAIPSSNIGTGYDEFVRDFISGRIVQEGDVFKVNGKDLEEVYPNANNHDLNMLAFQLQKAIKESTKGIHLISRDVTVNGTVSSVDANHKRHIVKVAGTLDLLGYDDKGNWYIYDMKTHRSPISDIKKARYARQLSLYKKFLENKYGIKIKELNIIPIKVNYPSPKGTEKGTTEYKVAQTKPKDYNGTKPNQLLVDGKEFKESKPFLGEFFEVDTKDIDIDYKKISEDPTGGLGSGALAVVEGIKALQAAYSDFITVFSSKALPEFVKFLKPFIGENVKIVEKGEKWYDKATDKEVSIERVLKEAPSDINLMQRWFLSVADNSSPILQIFDKVVKRVKDEKRLKVLKKAKEIIALGKEYEDRGITDYTRFFEDDRQRYITHLVIKGKDYSYDRSAYEKAKNEYLEELDEIYGKHPEIGTQAATDKNNALKRWIEGTDTNEGHAILVKDETGKEYKIPNPKYFPSKYNKLNETEKEFFEKWMEIKAELDNIIGPDHTFLTNTIKIRKNGIERIRGALSGDGIMEIVEEAKSKVMKSFDDEQNYASGIKGFTGEEIMKLPLYYIKAPNTTDISTDMIGTLVAYTEMVYNYEAMNEVVTPLELGKYLIYQQLNISDVRGRKPLQETFSVGGRTITSPINVSVAKSNLANALEDFFASKIYGRYLKEQPELIPNVDTNKAAGLLLKLGSTVQLGFNLFAWVANAATGASMQNIEAAAGEFFNAKELFTADKEFFKAMGHYVGDIGQRVATSKLSLFDELFDVRQNYKTKLKHLSFDNRNLLTRVFGPGIQYVGQDAGDHWLYNRTAIAMALRYKLRDKNNQTISLWDALEVVPLNEEHPEYGAQLVLKDGVTKEDGTEFTKKDISDLSGQMRYVNQHLFGIYNDDDSVAARRTVWGRFLLQYRDWIPSQLRYRFGTRTNSLEKGNKTEGYYITTARFMRELYKELQGGNANITQLWKELDDYDRKNIIRARTEVGQWLGICALVAILNRPDDDKDRPWAVRALKYLATRERTELGALVPFSMAPEMFQIAKSPFANTSVISDLWNLTLLLNPLNYMDEIESGDYKGHSSAYRAFMRSPLTLWYRTIKRTTRPERAEQYYKNK